MNKKINRRIGTQIDEKTDRQTYRNYMITKKDIYVDRQIDIDRQTGRKVFSQIDITGEKKTHNKKGIKSILKTKGMG